MRRFLLSLTLMTAVAAPALLAGTPARAEEFTRAQIEEIIRDYIANHPQEMIDSVTKFGEQQKVADDEAASKIVVEHLDWLTKNPNHAEAGNPKGDVTIVEFFDYNCGYCKEAMKDVMTLLDKDSNIRLVFVEIPILGQSSDVAARWALAAAKQKKYLPFHVALMRHKGPLDEATYLQYAKAAGLDVEQLQKDRLSKANDVIIEDNLRMARTLGIQGTPAFVIGNQLVRGYVGAEGLQQAVENAREEAKKK